MKTTADLPAKLPADVRVAADRHGWTVRTVFSRTLEATRPDRRPE